MFPFGVTKNDEKLESQQSTLRGAVTLRLPGRDGIRNPPTGLRGTHRSTAVSAKEITTMTKSKMFLGFFCDRFETTIWVTDFQVSSDLPLRGWMSKKGQRSG